MTALLGVYAQQTGPCLLNVHYKAYKGIPPSLKRSAGEHVFIHRSVCFVVKYSAVFLWKYAVALTTTIL